VNPPHPIIRAAAPLGAILFPQITIEGNIDLQEISRLPQVLDSIRADPMIHRKISFGTGNVVLQIGHELDRSKQPEIAIPTLFIHGTSDSITE
jgi:alpha-beta hydrolase superfamily lysophospholipase